MDGLTLAKDLIINKDNIRSKMWEAITNIDFPEDIWDMVSEWFSEKIDKYQQGGDVAEYTGGRDVTAIAMMFFVPSGGGLNKLFNKVLGKIKKVVSVVSDKVSTKLKRVILRMKNGKGSNLKLDLDTNPKLKKLFNESDNPKALTDAWKKMDEAGADEALRKNPGALDALSKPKGSRPDPSTYLDEDYIANHLNKFDDGAIRFTTQSKIDQYGSLGSKEAFTIPKSEFDNLIAETGGDFAKIEQRLGLNPGDLTGDDAVIAWIKKEDLGKIKIPSGNEAGVIDEFWIPGGKTSGGVSEGVVDLSDKNLLYNTYPF